METKEKLLLAARKEFLAKGYERASLRVMSKDAGFTAVLIYSYFKNKDDLFNTVVGKSEISKSWAERHPEEIALIVERDLVLNNRLIRSLSKLDTEVLLGML